MPNSSSSAHHSIPNWHWNAMHSPFQGIFIKYLILPDFVCAECEMKIYIINCWHVSFGTLCVTIIIDQTIITFKSSLRYAFQIWNWKKSIFFFVWGISVDLFNGVAFRYLEWRDIHSPAYSLYSFFLLSPRECNAMTWIEAIEHEISWYYVFCHLYKITCFV